MAIAGALEGGAAPLSMNALSLSSYFLAMASSAALTAFAFSSCALTM